MAGVFKVAPDAFNPPAAYWTQFYRAGRECQSYLPQVSPGDLPLFTFGTPIAGQVGGQAIYQGAFVTPSDFADDSNSYSNYQQIAGAPNTIKMFLTMFSNGTGGTYRISSVIRPGALSLSSDLNNLPIATAGDTTTINLLNDVQDIMGFNSGSNGAVIRGLYYDPDSDTLTAGVSGYYDTDATAAGTAVISGASVLSSASVKGLIPTDGGRRLGWWLSPLPTEYQASLGKTHLVGSGHVSSVISSTSLGPSMFGLNLSEMHSASVGGGNVDSPGYVQYLHTDDGSQVVGVTDAPGISTVLSTNILWNVLTSGAMNMVIPGTRTVLWLGTGWSGHGSIQYKPTINLDVTELSFNVAYYNETYNYVVWIDEFEIQTSVIEGDDSGTILNRLASQINEANISGVAANFDGTHVNITSSTPRHMSVNNYLGATTGTQSPGHDVINTHTPKAHYYMLFDLYDVVDAHNSAGNGSDVEPYEHGIYSPDTFPFAVEGGSASKEVTGGYISAITNQYVEITLTVDDGARDRDNVSHALYSVFRLNVAA